MGNELAVIQKHLTNSEGMMMLSSALGKPANSPEVMKYITGAVIEISKKATLKSCSPTSILNCLIECAQVGLAVDNRHLAYLVTYDGELALMPGYLGYVHKITEADPTAIVIVDVVFKGDKFSYSQNGENATFSHIPADPFSDNPKEVIGAYCYIKDSRGSTVTRMSIAELKVVRSKSKLSGEFTKNGRKTTWNEFELEMDRKSVVRRATKLRFPAAVAKLNAIDDRLFEMSNKPQLVTLSPTKPMPEAIGHDSEPQAQAQTQEPESAPISEPTPEKAQQNDNAQPEAGGELSFSGEVKMFMPQSGDILAGILVSGSWYHTDNAEVVALIENLKGQQVSGTYIVRKNGLHDVKIITTIGDAQ